MSKKATDIIYLSPDAKEMYLARKQEIMARGEVWSKHIVRLVLQEMLVERLDGEDKIDLSLITKVVEDDG